MSRLSRRSVTSPGADAPNILIVLLDDVGFGVAETFGGEVRTPTLTRLANEGLRYNAFHTPAICSPTRAALLTGRNHTRVGSGTIAERAVAFDGYTGVIPRSAATVAEVLRAYGYVASAFGKWHNTPATETTPMGPKDRWPTGYGFDHFYGFLAGETFDVGIDLGAPVAEAYAERRPFAFNGTIHTVKVAMGSRTESVVIDSLPIGKG